MGSRVDAVLENTATLPALLTQHCARILEHLKASALPSQSFTGRMAAYHMGWVDRYGHASESQPGKLIRPALCLWATEACGGDPESSLPVAAALEWVHNFTLIHDDIQDGDRERRSRDTVWAVWGQAQGINAGDALHALAFKNLTDRRVDPARHLEAIRIIADAVLVVVEGQALDLRLEGRPQTSPRTYLKMIRSKTGALIGASLEAGAAIAGARPEVADGLSRAGAQLGTAFQIRDDWLGTWGDPAATGKSSDGDIGRCKLTFPVVAGYGRMNDEHRAEMRRLFSDGAGDPSAVRRLLEAVGGPQLTSGAPAHFASAAVALVQTLGLPHYFVEAFTEVADYVASRSR